MDTTKSKQVARDAIKRQRLIQDEAEAVINSIARAYIPDFHFLDHAVSTFWTCDKSPIGMCVFLREEIGYQLVETECRYCAEPTERK